MPAPTRLRELPLGVLRAAFGPGRCAFLVQPGAFLHSEIAKLVPSLPVPDRAKPYWVFALPNAAVNVVGAAFTLTPPAPAAVKATGHATYDEAEAAYDAVARVDAGKASVARGVKGLSRIGTED